MNVSFDDLKRLVSWGLGNWWHFPIMFIIIIIISITLYLGYFVKTEDRMKTLIDWYGEITTLIGMQNGPTEISLPLVFSAILFSTIVAAIIFTLIIYALNKWKNEDINELKDELKELTAAKEDVQDLHEKARQSNERYELMKCAFEELNKEHQKITGDYWIDVEPTNYELKFGEINLKLQTIKDRIKQKTISYKELYKIAKDPNRYKT